ncbi:hypothetical protein F5Y14DRAFT_402702 [Nemania sp. NC0429]|nr:hypothetical protein F5Y14DRAFT_402702 [Nemania sp. NC0429]
MADADEPDDEHGRSTPHTPPSHQRRLRSEPSRARYRDDGDDDDDASLSPPASPSISLSSLGLSPLSPLRRPLSPPTLAPSSPLYPHSESGSPGLSHRRHDDAAQDSRAVLVQRLHDLTLQLSQRHRHLHDESIDILHAKVDELEHVLSTPDYSSGTTGDSRPSRLPSRGSADNGQDGSDHERRPSHPDNLLLASLASPTRPSPSAKTRADCQAGAKADSCASKMTLAQAEQVAAEAQGLHRSLEVVISNLRDRQEETEHIHGLLITRLERAAQRIIHLEEQLRDSERDRKESDAELLNLQIQLKAIEVQCLSYVPQGADEELRESIDAWKMEWSALKQKRARDRERLNDDTPTRRRAIE